MKAQKSRLYGWQQNPERESWWLPLPLLGWGMVLSLVIVAVLVYGPYLLVWLGGQ